MKSNEKVKMIIFGREREVEIYLVGDNEPDYSIETDNFEVVNLTKEEEKLLNWMRSVNFARYKNKIVKYINYLNELIGENVYDDYDLSDDDIFMPISILVNVSEFMDEETADVALFGESSYAEDGILIAFKNNKYFGISGFDDCMNCFEDENFDE